MVKACVVFCLLFLLLTSCKKEMDNEPPIIELISPTEFSSYNVLDFISVKAAISDNEIIESVSIGIYNSTTGEIEFPLKYFSVNKSNYTLETSFQVSDSLLLSGNYYFNIIAFDGKNRASSSSEIIINGIKKRKLEAIITTVDNNSTKIYSLNGNNNVTLFYQLGLNVFDIAINSIHQHLWMVDNNSGKLITYDLNRERIEFEDNIEVNGQTNPITDISYFDRKVYVSLKTGEIKAYNSSFTDMFTYFSSNQNSFPQKMAFHDEFIILAEKQTGSGNTNMVSVFNETGAVNTLTSISGSFLSFGKLSNQESVLLFKEPSSTLNVLRYNPELGTKQTLFQINGIEYHYVSFLSQPYFLLIGDNGTSILNIQTTFLNNLSLNKSGTDKSIAFDEVNKQIYIGQGDTLRIYSFPLGNLIDQIAFPEQISSVEIRYNR